MSRLRALIAITVAGLPLAGIAACEIESGPGTGALVELYTSEGCSSCPPADRRLAELRPTREVVPLALHVGYWDDLGWHDPFARAEFADRQSWLVGLGGTRTLYTPQFFVGSRSTRPTDLSRTIRRVNAVPARADIRLQATRTANDQLELRAKVRSRADGAVLYLAVAESGLSSEISAGENRGRRLGHDHVVRAWMGPLALRDGGLDLERTISRDPSWSLDRLEVVAFVQDPRTGEILQAVGADRCLATDEARS